MKGKSFDELFKEIDEREKADTVNTSIQQEEKKVKQKASIGKFIVAIDKNLAVREGPTKNSEIIHTLAPKDVIVAFSRRRAWLQINFTKDGQEYKGWVMRQFLQEV